MNGLKIEIAFFEKRLVSNTSGKFQGCLCGCKSAPVVLKYYSHKLTFIVKENCHLKDNVLDISVVVKYFHRTIKGILY